MLFSYVYLMADDAPMDISAVNYREYYDLTEVQHC